MSVMAAVLMGAFSFCAGWYSGLTLNQDKAT
ncbi:hypothetical protein HMPREF1051_0171, partial [Neisseria sicca VK64]